MTATAPDAVYIVRHGERNDELRHSLRSLANVPHGRVWIAGYAPTWAAVGAIPVRRHFDKYASARANLRAAAEHPDVSDPFVLLNDDFFVMAPHPDGLPMLHNGRLARAIRDRPTRASLYTRGMVATLDFLQSLGIREPRSYSLHVPMLVGKRELLDVLDMRPRHMPAFHVRTVYGNVHGVGGRFAHDVKVTSTSTGESWRRWPLLSTNDDSFARHAVGTYVRERFGEPSAYELPR